MDMTVGRHVQLTLFMGFILRLVGNIVNISGYHKRGEIEKAIVLGIASEAKCSGGTLYTTSSSCELCAKKALGDNIRRIVYVEPYSGITHYHTAQRFP